MVRLSKLLVLFLFISSAHAHAQVITGTIVSADRNKSIALLEINGYSTIAREGESIAGFTVQHIAFDYVLLNKVKFPVKVGKHIPTRIDNRQPPVIETTETVIIEEPNGIKRLTELMNPK